MVSTFGCLNNATRHTGPVPTLAKHEILTLGPSSISRISIQKNSLSKPQFKGT